MNRWLHQSTKFVKRNASTILTCVGGVGVVATSVMAVKATPKALMLIEEAKNEKGEDLTKLEIVKVAGPAYIPSVVMGAATVACIFGANALNKRQQAALMSAYALLDGSYKDYKKKVNELYGEDADLKVRQEIAKDNYNAEEDNVEDDDDGKHLFYDQYSGRYFRATNETVLNAKYEINKILNDDCYANLNELYDLFGIEKLDHGDYVGWSSAQMFDMYWDSWIHFWLEKTDLEDGMECFIIHFTDPTSNFEDY